MRYDYTRSVRSFQLSWICVLETCPRSGFRVCAFRGKVVILLPLRSWLAPNIPTGMRRDIARRFGGGKRTAERSNRCLKLAYRAVFNALNRQAVSRSERKTDLRSMWIDRIRAGTREHGVSRCAMGDLHGIWEPTMVRCLPPLQLEYNHFIHALKVENVQLDRKVC